MKYTSELEIVRADDNGLVLKINLQNSFTKKNEVESLGIFSREIPVFDKRHETDNEI